MGRHVTPKDAICPEHAALGNSRRGPGQPHRQPLRPATLTTQMSLPCVTSLVAPPRPRPCRATDVLCGCIPRPRPLQAGMPEPTEAHVPSPLSSHRGGQAQPQLLVTRRNPKDKTF